MSSAETELAAKVEACKELLSIGCLLDTLENGIPLDAFGCPKTQHNSLKMELYGLAVRPEHHGHVWTSPPGEARGVALRVSPAPGAAEAS